LVLAMASQGVLPLFGFVFEHFDLVGLLVGLDYLGSNFGAVDCGSLDERSNSRPAGTD
jgi:hypothetical protein